MSIRKKSSGSFNNKMQNALRVRNVRSLAEKRLYSTDLDHGKPNKYSTSTAQSAYETRFEGMNYRNISKDDYDDFIGHKTAYHSNVLSKIRRQNIEARTPAPVVEEVIMQNTQSTHGSTSGEAVMTMPEGVKSSTGGVASSPAITSSNKKDSSAVDLGHGFWKRNQELIECLELFDDEDDFGLSTDDLKRWELLRLRKQSEKDNSSTYINSLFNKEDAERIHEFLNIEDLDRIESKVQAENLENSEVELSNIDMLAEKEADNNQKFKVQSNFSKKTSGSSNGGNNDDHEDEDDDNHINRAIEDSSNEFMNKTSLNTKQKERSLFKRVSSSILKTANHKKKKAY